MAEFIAVGFKYYGYEPNYLRYRQITLEYEPNNIHDKNAIKVLVGGGNGTHVGYVSVDTQHIVNPYMNRINLYNIQVTKTTPGSATLKISPIYPKLDPSLSFELKYHNPLNHINLSQIHESKPILHASHNDILDVLEMGTIVEHPLVTKEGKFDEMEKQHFTNGILTDFFDYYYNYFISNCISYNPFNIFSKKNV